MKNTEKELTPLSASRIKTFENCSWLYYCNYILRIPQKNNNGARIGSVCHKVFETLLDEKYKPEYDLILKNDSVYSSELIKTIIYEQIKHNELSLNEENLNKINKFILVGLKTSFFVENEKLISPEYRFDYVNKKPQYRLKGFIDMPKKENKNLLIYDFKSSKKKYVGEEIVSNIQGLVYSLVATKLWPKLKPIVKFIFLQFPEDPILKVEFNKNTLKGFEEYLNVVQEKINNFTEKDAKNNFAFDKEFGKDTFTGKLMCGFNTKPNQIKKDGSGLVFGCPYKWAMDYYVLLKEGKIINSSLKNDLVAKEGEIIELRRYDGCPRWVNPLNDFSGSNKTINTTPALDDF